MNAYQKALELNPEEHFTLKAIKRLEKGSGKEALKEDVDEDSDDLNDQLPKKTSKSKLEKAIEKKITPMINYPVDAVHLPNIEKAGHPHVYLIETPKRWYYFYIKNLNDEGIIIENDLDGIDTEWQKKLNIREDGTLDNK